ncbi:MAG: hypothetical protein NZM11_05590 [Anaerolineales bacterium]|nr:hypothetical protein [Anaerolineales bacterium]
MFTLSLTEEERAILAAVLEEYIPELRMEVADTDSGDLRETLKHEEAVLKKILTALKSGA